MIKKFDKIEVVLAIILAFTIPLPLPLIVTSVILGFITLLGLVVNIGSERNTFHPNILPLLLFFILQVLGVRFSNLDIGLEKVVQLVPFILLPILLVKLSGRDFDYIFRAFIVGVFIYVIYISLYSAVYYIFTPFGYDGVTLFDRLRSIKYITATNVPGWYHKNYSGLYVNFAIVLLFKMKFLQKKWTTLLVIILSTWNFVYAGIISFSLTSILLIYGLSKIAKIRKFFSIIFFWILTFVIYFIFREKIIVSLSSRLQIWKSGLNIFMENPIWGVGTGLVKKAYYRYSMDNEINFTALNTISIDAHNIFIQELISHGLIGLVVITFTFSFYYYLSLKENNTLLFLFLSLILFVGFFEPILSRQRGIIFISFFLTLVIRNISYNFFKNHNTNEDKGIRCS